MPSTTVAAALAFLLWAVPTFAADFDADGVEDALDNCSEASNPFQDDTDGDDCGNLCDADYDNSGVVGHPDFFEIDVAWLSDEEEYCHFEARDPDGPVAGNCFVGLDDGAFLAVAFGSVPGPSGTTAGTTACP